MAADGAPFSAPPSSLKVVPPRIDWVSSDNETPAAYPPAAAAVVAEVVSSLNNAIQKKNKNRIIRDFQTSLGTRLAPSASGLPLHLPPDICPFRAVVRVNSVPQWGHMALTALPLFSL
jgi:hypothetical protein